MKNGLVLATDACVALNVESNYFINIPKYRDFYTPAKKGKHPALFDLKGFRKKEDLYTELKEKTTLLIEYLVHEEGLTYQRIADVTLTPVQNISSHNFSKEKAGRICANLRANFVGCIDRFDEYYGYKKRLVQ